MKPGRQIAFPREDIQQGPRKLHQPVHVCEVRDKTERDAHGATAPHPQIGEKLIPAHPSFPFEELRKRVPGLLMEDFAQRLFRQMEGSFASARVTKAAGAQGETHLAGSAVNHPFINHRPMRVEEIERDRSSAPISGVRAVDLHQRPPIAMAQGEECVK